ncbi:dCTP deaminase [Micromonospora sp. C51]|uniref:dCTP deaminase n=1 Tax=Micromonospora sp. C51 TaxID=2824879 RepID=UPI001B38E53F|nr:dCTP deaminase [Micromonospora sp. C51]MBQ1048501.1 dCTP deaminase [Micromonospora sp. C51]
MLASDVDLREAIRSGTLALDPFDDKLVQPASIDLRLHRWFRIFRVERHTVVDPAQEQADLTELVEVPDGEPFELRPGQFVLGTTLERVTIGSQVAARLEGKSSLGRLGLRNHSTAGFIDPGFDGHITLELSNDLPVPIRLWPGMLIGQVCVFTLQTPASLPYGATSYGSHYQGQVGPTPSRSWQRWRTWPTAA